MNPVISRKLPPPSSLSLSLHSFLPPSFFSPPCSYTRHEPTTTRTGTTMGIPRVCTRSYPDIWPSPVSKCFPVAEGGGRVVPLILNCYVGFTSVSPSITSNLALTSCFSSSGGRNRSIKKNSIRKSTLSWNFFFLFQLFYSRTGERIKFQDSKVERVYFYPPPI